MKKWITIAFVAVICVVGIMTVVALVQVNDNDRVLEEIRGDAEVIVLQVSGMD